MSKWEREAHRRLGDPEGPTRRKLREAQDKEAYGPLEKVISYRPQSTEKRMVALARKYAGAFPQGFTVRPLEDGGVEIAGLANE